MSKSSSLGLWSLVSYMLSIGGSPNYTYLGFLTYPAYIRLDSYPYSSYSLGFSSVSSNTFRRRDSTRPF